MRIEVPKDVAAGTCANINQSGYEPRVLGFIDYDRAGKAFRHRPTIVSGRIANTLFPVSTTTGAGLFTSD